MTDFLKRFSFIVNISNIIDRSLMTPQLYFMKQNLVIYNKKENKIRVLKGQSKKCVLPLNNIVLELLFQDMGFFLVIAKIFVFTY